MLKINSAPMKYSRLTKEQFEEMHAEFSSFLATQAIDKAEWDQIKIEKLELKSNTLLDFTCEVIPLNFNALPFFPKFLILRVSNFINFSLSNLKVTIANLLFIFISVLL